MAATLVKEQAMTELHPHGTEAVIIVSGEGGRLSEEKVHETAEFLSPLSLRRYPVPTIAGYAWHLGRMTPEHAAEIRRGLRAVWADQPAYVEWLTVSSSETISRPYHPRPWPRRDGERDL